LLGQVWVICPNPLQYRYCPFQILFWCSSGVDVLGLVLRSMKSVCVLVAVKGLWVAAGPCEVVLELLSAGLPFFQLPEPKFSYSTIGEMQQIPGIVGGHCRTGQEHFWSCCSGPSWVHCVLLGYYIGHWQCNVKTLHNRWRSCNWFV
jgi:hypothetical protein